MKKPDNPRVTSSLIKNWLEEFVKEDNSNCSYSQRSVETMTPMVSSTRPSNSSLKLDMLAEVARRELRNMEKPDYDFSRLKKLANIAARAYDKEYLVDKAKARREEAKALIFVNVLKKKRSLRLPRVTTPWGTTTNTFFIKPRNPKNNMKEHRPIYYLSKEEEEEIKSLKKRKTLTKETKIPEWLVNVMAREENAYDPKPIIVKNIYRTDLEKGQGRLSMPLKQVVCFDDFLNDEEKTVLRTHKESVSVVLVDPRLKKHEVKLRIWDMNGSSNYVFVNGWNAVVDKNIAEQENNKLKVGYVFHVWSFRRGEGQLCFALIPLNED